MKFIAKAFLGCFLGLGGVKVIKQPAILIPIFVILGLVFQVAYARCLNTYLDGADPVKFGARSLKQLKALMPIPWIITAFDILAKSFGIAAVIAVMYAFHILHKLLCDPLPILWTV